MTPMNTHPNLTSIEVLGSCAVAFGAPPIAPYDARVYRFLGELSARLMQNVAAKKFPDLISFAYWCRKSNIAKLKSQFIDDQIRIGRGVVFHITPSNVPVNFAFSYVFGILSGNSNVVRVPSRYYQQTDIILGAISDILELLEFRELAKMTCFVSYPQSDEITGFLSSKCDARIIWGGDVAIENIRKIAIPHRAVEVAFSDRYSLCLLNAQAFLCADKSKIELLAQKFFNDAFIYDQGACSSPRLVVWQGSEADVEKSKKFFWSAVYEIASEHYNLEQINAINKYTRLCAAAIELNSRTNFSFEDNLIYQINFMDPDGGIEKINMKYGAFFENRVDSLNEIKGLVSPGCQTLTYFGVPLTEIKNFIFECGLKGIDRVVPIGSALEIGPIWDGFDLIRTLSRVIEFR